MARIAAFDISKRSTGVACGDADGPPRSWVAHFDKPTAGGVGAAFSRFAQGVIKDNDAEVIVYEQALLVADRNASASTTRLLVGMTFALETVAHVAGVPIYAVAQQTWRKVFLGHGRPQNPKETCIRMCASLGWSVDHDDNRADACGVWAWGQHEHGDRKGLMRLLSKGGIMVR